MTNNYLFAKNEFDIIEKGQAAERPFILDFKDEILALAEKFGQSGQSWGSEYFAANIIGEAIIKILMREPIFPIYGTEEEWLCVDIENQLFRNERFGSIFKIGINGKPYYFDAVLFKRESGEVSTANFDVEGIENAQFIKSFPFIPKTFYIDVVEINGGYRIKDKKQLVKVFKYYDKRN